MELLGDSTPEQFFLAPARWGPLTTISGFIPSGKPIYNHVFFIGFAMVITTL